MKFHGVFGYFPNLGQHVALGSDKHAFGDCDTAVIITHRMTMLPAIIWFASTFILASTATTPASRDGWHAQRHADINTRVQAAQGEVDIVFIGDSITQGWEQAGRDVWAKHYGDRTALNLGISGDRTEHVLWRLDNGNLSGIRPRVAVVMIGTNNIGHGRHTTDEVLAGVRAVVERITAVSPNTRVVLLDIFPRGAAFNADRGRILQINQAMARLHDGSQVFYLPIGHVFIEDDGTIASTIMPDALHLSPAGYQRWADAIEPTLNQLLVDHGDATEVSR